MPKRPHKKGKKSKAKRPKPDASQSALAAVEKIIGGKLKNHPNN